MRRSVCIPDELADNRFILLWMCMLFMRTRLIRSMGIPLVVGLCFSFSQVSAKTPETRDAALIQALKETSEKRPDGLKNLIHTYCSTVLSD